MIPAIMLSRSAFVRRMDSVSCLGTDMKCALSTAADSMLSYIQGLEPVRYRQPIRR